MSWRNVWGFYIVLFSSPLLANETIKETCANGFALEALLDDSKRIREISFSDGSGISYEYEDEKLSRIVRYDPLGNELYAQTYNWEGSRLISQAGWFNTTYMYDDFDRVIAKLNPWCDEEIEYAASGNVIRIGDKRYCYDDLGQIIEESGLFHAVYDEKCNLLELNNKKFVVDEQNMLREYNYDLNGNHLNDGFVFEENQISEAQGERYFYDSLGRLIQKGNISYLYLGWEEIASFINGQCETLKIPGVGGPVAIEIKGKAYAPVTDSAGIIRKLIDPLTLAVYKENNCNIFGGGLSEAIPYAYRGKRYDSSTGLIYFGKRFYNPLIHRWVSPDPLGAIDHENLYQYVYNNPLKYCDPTGASFWGYVIGLGEVVAGGTIMLGGVGLEIATFGGFTLGFAVVESSGLALMADGLARATRESQNIKVPKWDKNYQLPEKYDKLLYPPYQGDQIGTNPANPEVEGFEWKGSGAPGTKEGSWYNPLTGESLHPDLDHPAPIKPHWDYEGPNGEKARLNTDGTWEWKE